MHLMVSLKPRPSLLLLRKKKGVRERRTTVWEMGLLFHRQMECRGFSLLQPLSKLMNIFITRGVSMVHHREFVLLLRKDVSQRSEVDSAMLKKFGFLWFAWLSIVFTQRALLTCFVVDAFIGTASFVTNASQSSKQTRDLCRNNYGLAWEYLQKRGRACSG